jgi:hypothetical protein
MQCMMKCAPSCDLRWSSRHASVVRVDKEADANDDIDAHQHGAFKVVALAVLHNVICEVGADEKHHGFESLEIKAHGLSNDPSEDDQERGNEECNLYAAANGH